jgi:hypothetical protein
MRETISDEIPPLRPLVENVPRISLESLRFHDCGSSPKSILIAVVTIWALLVALERTGNERRPSIGDLKNVVERERERETDGEMKGRCKRDRRKYRLILPRHELGRHARASLRR